MFRVPLFICPSKNLIRLYRKCVGLSGGRSVQTVCGKIDVVRSPLPTVFLLAVAMSRAGLRLDSRLRGVLAYARVGNAVVLSAFLRAVRALNDAGIPVMAQKGVVNKILSSDVVRPMNDADFLVPYMQYRDAIAVAQSAGFSLRYDMLGSADMQYRDMGRIDIHFQVFKGANPVMNDLIIGDAIVHKYCGVDVLIPRIEDRLVIIMCEFYGNFLYECRDPTRKVEEQFMRHPMWVLDAEKIIKSNPNLDWGRVMRIAEMSGCGYQIRVLLKLLNKILPGIVSKDVQKQLRVMCPDHVVWPKLHRDKKIVKIHKMNSRYYDKYYKNQGL